MFDGVDGFCGVTILTDTDLLPGEYISPLLSEKPASGVAVTVTVPELPAVTLADTLPFSTHKLLGETLPFDALKLTRPVQSTPEIVTVNCPPGCTVLVDALIENEAA